MWITPTAADVLASLPESERDLYAGLDEGGEDVLAAILANVVAKVRGRVGACPKNVSDPDTATIPVELKGELLAIVRYELIARLAAEEMSDTDPRTKVYNEALKTLAAVARCEVYIEPGATSVTSGVSLVSSRVRHDRRENLSGLL